MMQLFINTYGTYIKKHDDMFELVIDGKKTKITPEKVSSIVITNGVMLTSDVIKLAMDYNIDIIFLDEFGDPYGRIWYPKIGSTVAIRRRQLEIMGEPISLDFIKYTIHSKMSNQLAFVKKLLS